MERTTRDVIRQKIADSLTFTPQPLTRRDVQLPSIPNKAHAVIGMRRSGKTCFLHQCLTDRLDSGAPRDAMVYFSFEDERLADMRQGQLSWIIEEYFLQFPHYRDHRRVTFFFDEIQLVPGWETFIRRILDSEKIEVFVSGSSARMLSREIASSLRGRGTETVIFPYSFREYLRHRGIEPPSDPKFAPKAQRSKIAAAFRAYLTAGGFPEAQGLASRDRFPLLSNYVDTCILRDVLERHNMSNVLVLRWLIRRLLGSPGGQFSVSKCYHDLQSQGLAVAKDTLHRMLAHLEDAYLLRLVEIAGSSAQKRQVHPRKVYPIDHSLIPVYDRSAKANIGHLLESAVMIELERRRYRVSYVQTPMGYEVDFLAEPLSGSPLLIQVAAELSNDSTSQREVRALIDAIPSHPKSKPLLLTLATDGLPDYGLPVRAAWEWFLDDRSK